MTDKELFKVGMLLGASLSQLSEIQINTALERNNRAEVLLFNNAKVPESTLSEYSIDTEN